MKIHDFVIIGDTVTDAFIRLKEASVHCNINHERCEICMRFADKIPYEDVYVVRGVGNAGNAAVATSRLGMTTALVTNLGGDAEGDETLKLLGGEKIGTEFVTVHAGVKTNYHYVLWYEDDRTILIKHEPYAYALPDIGTPRWIYFSSVAETAFPFHYKIADHLDAHPEISLAFQPGKNEIKLGYEKLERLYRRAHIFFCNKEEAQTILDTEEGDVVKLLEGLRALGPRIAVITNGPKGAHAADGTAVWFTPMYPDPKPPLERTGAGDAFSAAVSAALALGKPLSEGLLWGPVNSMSVVQYVGGHEGLLTREKLEEHLTNAPADYKVEKVG